MSITIEYAKKPVEEVFEVTELMAREIYFYKGDDLIDQNLDDLTRGFFAPENDKDRIDNVSLTDLSKFIDNEHFFHSLVHNEIEFVPTRDELREDKAIDNMVKVINCFIHHAHTASKKTGIPREAYNSLKRKANNKAEILYAKILEIEKMGITSDNQIAQELSRQGVLTPRGKTNWQNVTVSRIRERVIHLHTS
ncbi:MAG: hypothetical protein HWE07_00695 [Cytophagia bacterium]|nr:hypothetical protein [Cytophagia bacterium]